MGASVREKGGVWFDPLRRKDPWCGVVGSSAEKREVW